MSELGKERSKKGEVVVYRVDRDGFSFMLFRLVSTGGYTITFMNNSWLEIMSQ